MSDTTDNDRCNDYMMCALFGHDHYYNSPIDCDSLCNYDQCDILLESHCSETVLYPPHNAFAYPSIRLKYIVKRHMMNWEENITPAYISYDEILCHESFTPTFFFGNLSCNLFEEFGLAHRIYARSDWNYLLRDIEKLFSVCSTNNNCSNDNQKHLFSCTNAHNSSCISKERLLDFSIDCPNQNGESSLLNTCEMNLSSRFRCFSTDNCIPRKFLVGGFPHCPDESDEIYFKIGCYERDDLGCQWIRDTIKNAYNFVFRKVCDGIIDITIENMTDESDCELLSCETSFTRCNQTYRCDFEFDYDEGEDDWFCDVSDEVIQTIYGAVMRPESSLLYFNPYPVLDTSTTMNVVSKELKSFVETESVNTFRENCQSLAEYLGYSCNRGVLVHRQQNNSDHCFCPASYYGDRCEYQRKRISITFQFDTPVTLFKPRTVIRLVFYLINNSTDEEGEFVIHFEQITHMPYSYSTNKYFLYLLYLRKTPTKDNYYVRTDAFLLTTSNVMFIATWYHRLVFPFLPIRRLALKLVLQEEHSNELCERRAKCLHGTCVPFQNLHDKYFCKCNTGWSGLYCDQVDNVCKKDVCALNAFCINQLTTTRPTCICPLGQTGPTCCVRDLQCEVNPCYNGGTCIPLNSRSSKENTFVCVCQKEFTGSQCQQPCKKMNIYFNQTLTDAVVNSIPVVAIHFVSVSRTPVGQEDQTPVMKQYYRFIFTDVHVGTYMPTIYYDVIGKIDASFIQIFEDTQNSYGKYYLVALYNDTKKQINSLNTSVIEQNRCPYINECFNDSVVNSFQLNRAKYYQLPYQENRKLVFMCLCDRTHSTECFLFGHNKGQCTGVNYCINDGLYCYYGSLCQFTTSDYMLSIDSLIGPDIRTNVTTLKQQLSIVKVYLGLSIVLIIIGSILNLLSFMTFCQRKTREVGCGIYLLCSSVINQISLCIYFSKFLYLLQIQMFNKRNIYACVILEYLIRVLPSVCDYINAFVTVECAYTLGIRGTIFQK
ncbi:unnamed protein product [Didymodactylos carnosus]|uniref:EGF-like domain-containing protein n=1 Tax=Didymodactylos carnosus TaxID=1234261 RepID=A0A8S2DAK1_9BILA|nr:unnamed protein product [Didymodactylos carnosus]CAF3634709.1 unnamed protein product [Didymodactylos carnosus]